MEQGNFNKLPGSSSAAAAATIGGEEQRAAKECYMPGANVTRIMRGILPPNAKIADDAKEMAQQCVSEFIAFITQEANEKCNRELRKTVKAEDLMWAMSQLGFQQYLPLLSRYLEKYRESESRRTFIRGEVPPHVRRRADVVVGSSSDRAPAAYEPNPNMVPANSGFMGGAMELHGLTRAVDWPSTYEDGHGLGDGSSSNQDSMGIFDPFAQFK